MAEREWMAAPEGWLEEVIEAGAFAEAFGTYHATETKAQARLTGGLFDRVRTLEFEIADQEIRDAR